MLTKPAKISKILSLALSFFLIVQFFYFAPKPKEAQANGGASWYDSSWLYRKQLTFDNSGQSENLTNFPALVHLTASNFDFTHAKDNGEDIRFTDSDGTTLLKYEIEQWDQSGQDACIWVKVPQIDALSTTDNIYLYYGHSQASDSQDPQNVWDTTAAVWHLKESGNGTAAEYEDSTAVNNGQGGAGDSGKTPTRVDGKIGKAQSFDGVDDYIRVSDNDSLDAASSITLEAWIYMETTLVDVIGDIISKFDQTNKKGVNLSILNNAGSYGSQSNFRHLFFGIDNNKPDNIWVEKAPKLGTETYIRTMAVYNGKLYGGTASNGKLYEWNGIDAWVEKAPTFGAETNIYSMAVYNGKLYGGTRSNGKLYEWNGTDAWVEKAPTLGTETDIRSLAVYNGKLYGGTYPNGKLYEWNGTDAWVEKAPKLGDEGNIHCLGVYNGKLYGGTDPNGKLYEWNGTDAWVEKAPKLGAETFIRSLAVYNGKLYGGTSGNGKLYEWNGTDAWVEKAPKLGAEITIYTLIVYNGKLYGGTGSNAKLYEWNGTDAWVEKAPKPGSEINIYSMAVYNGKLYGGTYSNITGAGGKLYEWKTGISATYDYEMASGWQHITAVKESGYLKLYLNGILIDTSDSFNSEDYDLTNINDLLIGFGMQDYFNGKIDEVRISNSARSASWISANYNNQNSPSTFYSVASEETYPTNFRSTGASRGSLSLSVTSFSNDTSGSAGYYFYRTDKLTRNSGWIQSNSWTETGLDCDTTYQYSVKYRNSDGVESPAISLSRITDHCVSSGEPDNIDKAAEPSSPSKTRFNPAGDFNILINGGAKNTNTRQVKLKLFAGSNVKYMFISENPDFKGARQEQYQEDKIWTLSKGDGKKTIYTKFLSLYDVPSQMVSNTITLDTTAPSPPTILSPGQHSTLTDNTSPITGTAEPGSSVTLELTASDGTTSYYYTTTDQRGNWYYTFLTSLEDQGYTLKATAQDQAGNLSQETKLNFKIESKSAEILKPKILQEEPLPPSETEPEELSKSAEEPQTEEEEEIPPAPERPTPPPLSLPSNTPIFKSLSGNINILPESEEGTLHLTSGQTFKSFVKPEKPVKTIKVTIIFLKPRESSSYENHRESVLSFLLGLEEAQAQIWRIAEFTLEDQDNNGIYEGEIILPQTTGEYILRTTLFYEDGTIEDLDTQTLIDPKGYIYTETKDGLETRIKEAKVSLYAFNPDKEEFALWNAQNFDQENPQTMDKTGEYEFLVPEGRYYLKVEAKNYQPYQSEEFIAREGEVISKNIQLIPVKKFSWKWVVLIGAIILALVIGILIGLKKRKE